MIVISFLYNESQIVWPFKRSLTRKFYYGVTYKIPTMLTIWRQVWTIRNQLILNKSYIVLLQGIFNVCSKICEIIIKGELCSKIYILWSIDFNMASCLFIAVEISAEKLNTNIKDFGNQFTVKTQLEKKHFIH